MLKVYLIAALVAFIFATEFTRRTIRAANKWKVLDIPNEPRKIHKEPTPLMGGLAIFLALFSTVLLVVMSNNYLTEHNLKIKFFVGIFFAGLVLMIGGILDDKYRLKPWQQFISPVFAALIVIASGIGADVITNPFGGIIHLNQWEQVLFWWQGIAYKISLPADLFTFVWLLGMMYTTKFLDGLDGLVTGTSAIGGLIIFAFAAFTSFYQPDVALFAIIFAGACLGFLIFNFNPAKIFLGEGGSLFLGFMLGVLAIISGSKIATTLLIMGIPILDVLWVILRRLWQRRSPFRGDDKHLHFRLLEIGFSQRQSVLFLYGLTAIFGLTALFLQSFEKLIALGFVLVFMVILGIILVLIYRHKTNKAGGLTKQ